MRKIIYLFYITLIISLPTVAFSQNSDTLREVKTVLSMPRSYFSLGEVVVTGTREQTDIRHLPMTISVVHQPQIQNRYEQSLLPIISEQVPGLFITARGILGYGVSGGGSGGMKIRGIGGGATTGVLMLIDGHPQYMGLMGHPVADSYQSILAEKVEVLRGPASVLYGSNAMGGVINIVSRKLPRDSRHSDIRLGYGSYNTLTTEASNQYSKGRFNNVITASYNRTDGHRTDMEFEQFSGYTKLGYDFSKAWKAFADVNITHFNASNPGSVTVPLLDNDSHITRGIASLSLDNDYDKTAGSLKLFYNWGRHKINDGYAPGSSPREFLFNSKDLMLGVNWYQSVSLFSGNRVTAGVDFQQFGGEAWNQFNVGTQTEIIDRTENEKAGYLSVRQMIGGMVAINAGIRADHHSQTGTEWVPQGGIALDLRNSSEIKVMVSKGFRNPTIREMYMFPPQNPNLRPERMMNYELSYAKRLLNNALSYGVNVFYIKGENMIQTIFANGKPLNVNTDEVENWGIESNVNYRIYPTWTVSANYSWLRMQFPVVAAPEHKLYVGVDFKKEKWNVSSGVQYVSGLYTNVNTVPNTKDDFVLWNVRASYRLHAIASLYIKGENLLAQDYEINAGYPMPKATVMCGVNFSF